MIINKTYFKGLTEIANANDSAPLSDKVGNSVVLDVMIKKYEPLLLIKLLGYDLYKLLTDQFDKTNNDWVLNTGVEQKWKDLVKGAEVVYDGVTYKWDGLANGEDSLIAYFIYSKYIEELEIQHTGIGLVQEKAEKAERVNGRTKIIDAYNQFYCKAIENDTHTYLSLYDYIKYQNDVNGQDYYPKWLPSFTFELKNRYI
jgi:hypothetical protein